MHSRCHQNTIVLLRCIGSTSKYFNKASIWSLRLKLLKKKKNPPKRPFVSLWHPNDSLHRHKGLLTSSNLISELGPKTSTCIYLMPCVNPRLCKHVKMQPI